MIEVALTASPKEKHVLLYQAIQRLNEILERLDDLTTRINGLTPVGDGTIKSERKPEDPPSLSLLLNGGPGMIDKKIGEIQERITLLYDLLF